MRNIKTRKSVFLTLLCAAALMLAGCSLLDVAPRGQEENTDLFSREDGFRFALTGVYIDMAHTSLYGRAMSYEMPEWLVRHFNISDNNTYGNYIYSNYDFVNDRGDDRVNGAWTRFYHSIAQVNDMLEALETANNAMFTTPEMRSIIEGELYGLRGFLHTEVLRFWGPVPNSGVSQSTLAVPYITKPTLDVAQLSDDTWKTVVDGIVSDLSRAEELLSENDPMVLDADPLEKSVTNEDANPDPWLRFRQNRMNYAAVMGTKARLYSWIEKTGYAPTDPVTEESDAVENAIHYAQGVIGLTRIDPTEEVVYTNPVISLITQSELASNGFILFNECLFALDVQKLQENQKDFNTTVEASSGNIRLPERYMKKNALDEVYEYNEVYAKNDMRYVANNLWIEHNPLVTDKDMIFRKYYDYLDPSNTNLKIGNNANQVPLMRLSEMYLILMEYLDLVKATEAYDNLRIARNLDAAIMTEFTADTRMERVQKEYQKEFYGEGQFFFFCKRKALTAIPIDNWQLPHGISDYVMPKPRSQTDFE